MARKNLPSKPSPRSSPRHRAPATVPKDVDDDVSMTSITELSLKSTGTNHSPPRGNHAPPSKKQDLNTTPPRHLKPPPSVSTTPNTPITDIPALDSPLVKDPLPFSPAPHSVATTAASSTTPQSALKTGRFSGTPPLTPRQVALDTANKAHSASFIWHYYGEVKEGKFPTSPLFTAWKSNHKRIVTSSRKYTHYFSLDDGKDLTSLHDGAKQKLPAAFDAHYGKSWRQGTIDEYALLIQLGFDAVRPTWPHEDLRAFAVSLRRTSPEAFDDLYVTGNLRDSPEVRAWIAANRVLGSNWMLSKIPPTPAPAPGSATASRKVSFLSSSAGSEVDRGTGLGYYMTNPATFGIRSKDSRQPRDVTAGEHPGPGTMAF